MFSTTDFTIYTTQTHEYTPHLHILFNMHSNISSHIWPVVSESDYNTSYIPTHFTLHYLINLKVFGVVLRYFFGLLQFPVSQALQCNLQQVTFFPCGNRLTPLQKWSLLLRNYEALN